MPAENMEHNTSLQNADTGADKRDFTLYGIGAADSSSSVMQDTAGRLIHVIIHSFLSGL